MGSSLISVDASHGKCDLSVRVLADLLREAASPLPPNFRRKYNRRPSENRNKPCRFFLKGFCRLGNSCQFSHSQAIREIPSQTSKFSFRVAIASSHKSSKSTAFSHSYWPSAAYQYQSLGNSSCQPSPPSTPPSEIETVFDFFGVPFAPSKKAPPSLSSSQSSPSTVASEVLAEDSVLRDEQLTPLASTFGHQSFSQALHLRLDEPEEFPYLPGWQPIHPFGNDNAGAAGSTHMGQSMFPPLKGESVIFHKSIISTNLVIFSEQTLQILSEERL